jgi:hypothetical protein
MNEQPPTAVPSIHFGVRPRWMSDTDRQGPLGFCC